VLGVLRWLRALDEVLTRHCRKPLEKLDREVRAVLRLGLFESVQLGVPPAVATDGAAHAVRRLGLGSAASLVVAVLRRAIPAWDDVIDGAAPDIRLSHPQWLFERWTSLFGSEAAQDMMAIDQQPAPMWVWFIDDDARSALEYEGLELEAHPWCPGAWRARNEVFRLVAKLRSKEAYAQDPSSRLVALIARDLTPADCRFVDLCAAPGGKAAIVARRASWTSAVACDLRPRRATLMRDLLARSGACSTVITDSTRPPFPDGGFELVLLDAPCTGTGTLRRHPELRWRLQPESIGESEALQRALIDAAVGLVGPAGVLVYATCSIEPEENEGHFERRVEGFESVDLEAFLPDGVPWIGTGAGGIRILPHADGDGFSLHALRRKARLIQNSMG
jgi:16S rRNA (cytosine967-C5)-methyltransferase